VADRTAGSGPGLFAQLLAEPGVVESVDLRDGIGLRVGVMAFHGGSLEVGTDQIAGAAAVAAGASLYTVTQPDDLTWHIPSKLVDPAESARLAGFLDHVDTVVAVHGYGRPDRFTTVLLGGRNRTLSGHLARHLRPALPDYTIIDDLEAIPVELRGQHPDNPVNLVSGHGVQMELPPRIRGQGPFWRDHPPGRPVPHTEALIAGLAAALVAWPGGD
jgi:phage replication-related protein YjqB (UPF0714/DUF867 family)